MFTKLFTTLCPYAFGPVSLSMSPYRVHPALCDMLRTELRVASLRKGETRDQPRIRARVLESLRFGDYLYEAGWCRCGAEVLALAQDLLGLLVPPATRALQLECLVRLLRAQIGACLTEIPRKKKCITRKQNLLFCFSSKLCFRLCFLEFEMKILTSNNNTTS